MIQNTSEQLRLKLKMDSMTPTPPVPTTITLTKEVYDKVFLERYFVYRITDNFLFEVAKENYQQINDVIFKKVQLTWKISGPANNVYTNNVLSVPGVIEYNTKQTKIASRTIPQLLDYLTNPTQYYLGY